MANKEFLPMTDEPETEVVPAEEVEILPSSTFDDSHAVEHIAFKVIDTVAQSAKPNAKVVETIMNDPDTPLEKRVDSVIKYENNHGEEFRKNMRTVAGVGLTIVGTGMVIKKLSDEGII